MVITADHRNGFGGYTIRSYPEGTLLPYIKQVLWVTASVMD